MALKEEQARRAIELEAIKARAAEVERGLGSGLQNVRDNGERLSVAPIQPAIGGAIGGGTPIALRNGQIGNSNNTANRQNGLFPASVVAQNSAGNASSNVTSAQGASAGVPKTISANGNTSSTITSSKSTTNTRAARALLSVVTQPNSKA
ncbi:hypothetical protein EBQ74_11110, partial [bacterium]|nr:hypothetical protein [bacterium]